MNLIWKMSTRDYEPLSLDASYLYSEYDKIVSVLNREFKEYADILSKPVVVRGNVDWYGNLSTPTKRLDEIGEDTKIEIKQQYWQWRELLAEKISILKNARGADERRWGALLEAVFDDDNNIILTDGKRWCVLWGWQFSNKQENYLAPEYLSTNPEQTGNIIKENIEEPISKVPNDHNSFEEPIIDEPNRGNGTTVGVTRNRVGFFSAFIESLRLFVARNWIWFLIILILLWSLCLFKSCDSANL